MELPDFISSGPVGGKFNVNYYYEPDSQYGVPALKPTPGIYRILDLQDYPIRGMIVHKNVLYIVCGPSFYSYTGSGAATLIANGTIDTSSGPVIMAAGGNYVAFVDRTYAKIYNYLIGGSLKETTSPSSIVPSSITYQDTFFIIGNKNDRTVYCSASDDPQSPWSATDVRTKEGRGDIDPIVYSTGTSLWVMGQESTEVWYYTAASTGLPFARIGEALLDVGCLAPASVQLIDNSIFWLNNRCEVCRSSGYNYEVVSPPQLNQQIQIMAESGVTYVNEAIGYIVVWQGHPWYCLTFPDWTATWVYDIAAAAAGQKGWFRWTYASTTARHRGNCSAYLKGKTYIGDYGLTGYVYTLLEQNYTDDGEDQYHVAYSKYLGAPGKRIVYHSFTPRMAYQEYGQNTTYIKTSTTLASTASAGATEITVASTSGWTVGDVAYFRLDSLSYHHATITSIASPKLKFGSDDAVPSTATSGKTVYCFDYYSFHPQITLAVDRATEEGPDFSETKIATTVSGGTSTEFVNPVRWSALGSGYENLFTLTYRGCGEPVLLGADLEFTVGKH